MKCRGSRRVVMCAYAITDPGTVHWGPDVVPRNCRWAVPVVVPVGRIRRRLVPSAMHKSRYVKDRKKERERDDTWRIHEFYIVAIAAVILSVMAN